MAAPETLTASIDHVIQLFNTKGMDLPDGLFDRRTQFVLNGAAFETLLGRSPAAVDKPEGLSPHPDPLILMLARGPAGYRFAAKALQHALPDATLERGDVVRHDDPLKVTFRLWLSGTLRGTGEALNTVVEVALRLAGPGHIEVAEVEVEPSGLAKIREARLRS